MWLNIPSWIGACKLATVPGVFHMHALASAHTQQLCAWLEKLTPFTLTADSNCSQQFRICIYVQCTSCLQIVMALKGVQMPPPLNETLLMCYMYIVHIIYQCFPALSQIGTLDVLVALSDQLQKLDPFVEK